ncbi:MAG: hypothetical protein WCO18_01070 [bacterium]
MEEKKEIEHRKKKDFNTIPLAIVVGAIIISGTIYYSNKSAEVKVSSNRNQSAKAGALTSALEEEVIPSGGVVLPVTWGDLGTKLVSDGVIDAEKFKAIYDQRGIFTDEDRSLLEGQNNGKLTITKDNAGYLLNLLWALGLANKNSVLDSGEMVDPKYGGAQNFASTGGWTISKGDPMDHYSKHLLVTLTPEEQVLVEKVSKNIFRPCCGNSTHFPDCNHGMAMLGLLELMASQGASEQDMYKTALVVNSYWFPNNYLTIATYMKSKGTDWKNVDPQEMLSANYSSNQGYAAIASKVVQQPQSQSGGSGCGVDSGAPAATSEPQVSCGV